MSIAEDVAAAFHAAKRTTNIPAIAAEHGAVRTKLHNKLHYLFPDNSVLTTSGRGRGHKISISQKER